MSIEFQPFDKIPRYSHRKVVITEKIDGTNGQIFLFNPEEENIPESTKVLHIAGGLCMLVGSRNRYIYPEMIFGKGTDNYGFADWCYENAEELVKLGPGRHYGEWYGAGLPYNYGLDHRRFALFNVKRWGPHNPNTPDCCDVVPLLYEGEIKEDTIPAIMQDLQDKGSVLVEGYSMPKGIIVYDCTTKSYLKKTFKHDDGKWRDKV